MGDTLIIGALIGRIAAIILIVLGVLPKQLKELKQPNGLRWLKIYLLSGSLLLLFLSFISLGFNLCRSELLPMCAVSSFQLSLISFINGLSGLAGALILYGVYRDSR